MKTTYSISLLSHSAAAEPCVSVKNPFGDEVAAGSFEEGKWRWIIPGGFSRLQQESILSPMAQALVVSNRDSDAFVGLTFTVEAA